MHALCSVRSFQFAAGVLSVVTLASPVATAQTIDVTFPPATIVPNYSRVPVGLNEALEGGAYVARVNGATSNWYNPAGLAHTDSSVINASINGYEYTFINLSGFDETGRNHRVGTVPGFFGFVLGPPVLKVKGLALGFSVTRQILWDGSFSATKTTERATGTESFLYDSSVGFNTLVPQVAVGYSLSDRWRIGAGLAVAATSIARAVTISDDLVGPTVTNTQLGTSRLNGSVWSLVPSVGVQFDINKHWTAGLAVKSPGIRLTGTGSVQLNAAAFDGTFASASLLDTQARFGYRPPLQVAAGVAWSIDRAAVEVNVNYYDTLGDLTLFSSEKPIDVTTVTPAGARTDSTVPFPDLVYKTQPVFDVAIGGRYALSKSLELHAGFYTDLSPVSSSNRVVFQQIDLFGGTAGVSWQGENVSANVGAVVLHGSSGTFTIAQNIAGDNTDTDFSVWTVAMLYALSYKF